MRLLAFDLETGGLDCRTCGITQVATAIADVDDDYTNPVIVHRFSSLVLPEDGMDYTFEALQIQGVTLEVLKAQGRALPDVIAAVGKVVAKYFYSPKKCSPWAHNASFDTDFLRAACARTKQPYPFNGCHCCTMNLFRVMRHAGFHEEYKANLETTARTLGIEQVQAHGAADDAQVCLLAAVEMMRRLRKGVE